MSDGRPLETFWESLRARLPLLELQGTPPRSQLFLVRAKSAVSSALYPFWSVFPQLLEYFPDSDAIRDRRAEVNLKPL